jgi:hypothetical protein
MNRQQAIDFVAQHSEDDEIDKDDMVAAFIAVFDRDPDDEDRENGLWSMLVWDCVDNERRD